MPLEMSRVVVAPISKETAAQALDLRVLLVSGLGFRVQGLGLGCRVYGAFKGLWLQGS